MCQVYDFVRLSPQFKICDFHMYSTMYKTRFYFIQLFLQLVSPNFWPFLLQYVIHVFFLTFTVRNCGQHWHTYKSGCLRLFEDRKDWVAANQHCATFNTCSGGNGRLISIFSQVDNDQIGNFTSSLACPHGMVSHSYFRV